MAGWPTKIRWNAFTVWHARHERKLPYRSLDEISAVQNRRVRSMIRHAYRTVPYYRSEMEKRGLQPDDFQSVEDLAKLPILTGDQLVRVPDRFLSSRYTGNRSLAIQTTGTSGHVKSIRYNPSALFLSLAGGHRQRIVLSRFTGRTTGYREITDADPHSTSFQLRQFYQTHSWVPTGVEFKRDVLDTSRCFDENIRQVNAFKPDVITGQGTYVGALFRWAWAQGADVHHPKAVWYSSDRMADADRHLIETDYGIPVFSTYQASEALRIAFQCERREGFHVNLDMVAVRVVNESGNPVGPGGKGEIILSNLTNRATVLLNYQLGDRVTWSRFPCPCGRSLPTLERIDGRADDLIVRPGGRMIYGPFVTEGPSFVPGVVQAQLIQEDLQRFHLRVVCLEGTDWDGMRSRLDSALKSELGEDISAQIERMDAIPSEPGGKVRAVISRCVEKMTKDK